MDFGRLVVLPMILTQGLWVASRAMQLPAPGGPRSGMVGQGPPLRLLVVGDSSAEGVGVSHQDAALVGRTAGRLAGDFTVHWRVVAKTGATAGKTVKHLMEIDAEPFDLAITALGVNDSKNGIGAAAWSANYQAVFDILKTKFGVRDILACGLPPIHDFPLLPNPLRSILARRARYFEELLQNVIAMDDAVRFLEMPGTLDPTLMAEDGFHPGSQIYDEWGEHVAAAISALLCEKPLHDIAREGEVSPLRSQT